MMQALLTPDPAEQRPPIWAQTLPKRERPPHSVDEHHPGLLERALKMGAEIFPGVQSGLRELVRDDTLAHAQPYQAPPTMLNVRISGSRRFAAQSFALERFQAIGKAASATINDVTLAVCAGTLRRYLLAHGALPERPLTAMVPVSLRDPGQDGGNALSILIANLGTHLEDPLERMNLIIESTTLAKDRLAKMSKLERVAHAAAMSAPMGASMVTGYAKRRPIYNVVISNVPGPKQLLYLDGMRLDESYPVSIPVDYLALNITITGYNKELGFGYTACRRSVPALQRMLDYTDESLRELEAALQLGARDAAV
jgi:diacylglycerol O-acyltransferase